MGLRTIIVTIGLFLISCEIIESLKSRNASDHETKQKELETIMEQEGMSEQDKDFNDLQLIKDDKKVNTLPHNSMHHRKSDPCYFKRCYPGQKCQVNPQTGRARCICKTHCKNIKKPLCGTDGKFYLNHCEMYRKSCTTMSNIYDARNKDCFYQRSECSAVQFEAFLVNFLEYHESSINYMRRNTEPELKKMFNENAPKRAKRSRPGRTHSHHKKAVRIDFDSNEYDMVPPPQYETVHAVRPKVVIPLSTLSPKKIEISTLHKEPQTNQTAFVSETTFRQSDQDVVIEENPRPLQVVFDTSYIDDVITSDERGDAVKALFKFMDLDINNLVGSEEMYELVMFENLDTVIPPPCSIFHILNLADKNSDRFLDVYEMFAIYNVTVLKLDEKDREVNVVAEHMEDTTLHCGIQGESSPIWRRHGYDFNVYSPPNVVVNDADIIIKRISPIHAGNYTCHARKGTNLFQVIILSVHIGPRVEIYPRNQHIIEGNSATLLCHVSGIPLPVVTWLINGEPIDVESDRYILMGNNSELHLNSAEVGDSAAYSCLANNGIDSSEEIAAVFVEDNNQSITEFAASSAISFVAFHNAGIRIISPQSCQELRNIHNTVTVPGLLRQNKLCKKTQADGKRQCIWGTATTVGSRFVYATQPRENRIVVVDIRLQRVVEILATDESPISLQYVKSSDQLFVFCHNDNILGRSTIQVVYAASIPGAHSAAQIQPLDGGMRVDLAIETFFIPDEGIANLESKYGYISHKNDQRVYKLNLSTLLYETDVIDLNPYACIPKRFSYQPIGGRLDITCLTMQDERPRTLTVELATNRVIDLNQDTGYDREFVSKDSRHLIRVFPFEQMVKVYNISTSGDISESIVLHTNFRVADAIFVETLSHIEAATIYISSKDQGDLMYMDAASGNVEVIDSLAPPIAIDILPSGIENRKLISSAWYDSHVAVGGITELEIINVVNNEISCRFDDLVDTTAIAWVDEMN